MFQKIFYLSCLTLVILLCSLSNNGSTLTGSVVNDDLAAIHGWGLGARLARRPVVTPG